jgi:hypothetical protein
MNYGGANSDMSWVLRGALEVGWPQRVVLSWEERTRHLIRASLGRSMTLCKVTISL